MPPDLPFLRNRLEPEDEQRLIDEVLSVPPEDEDCHQSQQPDAPDLGSEESGDQSVHMVFYPPPPGSGYNDNHPSSSGSRSIWETAYQYLLNAIQGCKKAFRKFCNWLFGNNLWDTVKYIPGLNTVLGTIRVIRQVMDGDYVEAAQTACWAIGGAAAALAVAYLPVVGFIAFLIASPINNVVGGGGSLLLEWLRGGLKDFSWGDIFEKVYQDIIRYTPIFAYGVCPFRCFSQFMNGRYGAAKATAVDFLVNCLAIGVAGWLSNSVNWDKVAKLAQVGIESTSNAFVSFLSRLFGRLACGGIDVIKTIISSIAHRFTRVNLSMTPNREEFANYLQNPSHVVADLTDNPQEIKKLRGQLCDYVVGCCIEGYVDHKVVRANGQHVSALELACQGGDPILLQCILAFQPNVTTHRAWSQILPTLRSNARDNPCLLNVLNAPFGEMNERNVTSNNPCCSNLAHKRIWLPNSQNPVLCRPSGVRPRAVPCRVLCIDGGGTRGLIAIVQLLRICDNSPQEYFDLMVGTSTGALIILLLATGKSLKDILVLYFKMCKAIFKKKLGSKDLEGMFKKYFKDMKMGDIPQSTKVLITTTTMRNRTFEARFITNFHDDCKELYVRDVARRTTAAPGFIPPAYDREGTVCLDGGLMHNNPVVAALRNVIDLEDATVVSIGTGRFSRDNVPRNLSGLEFWVEFVKAFKRTATDSNGEVLENAKYICNLGKAYLFRLNPSLPEDLSLNEIGYPKLVNAMWVAEAYANEHCAIFEEIRDRIKP